MAYSAMSDGAGGGNWQKLLEEQLKKQFSEGASQKSAQASAQSAQGDSQQVAMQKAVSSQKMKKQQASSQNNMPDNRGGGGGNSMSGGGSGGGGGKNQLGTDIEKREKTDVMESGMDAFTKSGGNVYAAAAAVALAGLEETEAIRQERKEIEKKAKEEEAKGVQNVGDIWTALAGQMKGLLR